MAAVWVVKNCCFNRSFFSVEICTEYAILLLLWFFDPHLGIKIILAFPCLKIVTCFLFIFIFLGIWLKCWCSVPALQWDTLLAETLIPGYTEDILGAIGISLLQTVSDLAPNRSVKRFCFWKKLFCTDYRNRIFLPNLHPSSVQIFRLPFYYF